MAHARSGPCSFEVYASMTHAEAVSTVLAVDDSITYTEAHSMVFTLDAHAGAYPVADGFGRVCSDDSDRGYCAKIGSDCSDGSDVG